MGAVLLPAVWAPWWGCWRVVKTRGTAPLLITDRFDVEKCIFLCRILASIAPTPVQWARPHARVNNMRGCGRSEPAASRRWRTSAVAIPPPRWANAWYLPMRHTHSLIYNICAIASGGMGKCIFLAYHRAPRAHSRAIGTPPYSPHRAPRLSPSDSCVLRTAVGKYQNPRGQMPFAHPHFCICPPPFLHLPTPKSTQKS